MYNGNGVEILSSLYFFIRGEIMEVERKIRKVGNSLGVLLPADMLKEIGVKDGDTVFVSVEDGEIKIRSNTKKDENETFKKRVLKIIEEYMDEQDKLSNK
jgi:putative addiction module antidote